MTYAVNGPTFVPEASARLDPVGMRIGEKDAQRVWIKVGKDSHRHPENGETKKSYESRTKAIEENWVFIL